MPGCFYLYAFNWYSRHNMASFSLVVTHPPLDQQHAYTAYRFSLAVIKAGHSLHGVFFYQAGVQNANNFQTSQSDEFNLHQAWTELSSQYDIPLLVCVSAANRRGIINHQDAGDLDKEHFNLTTPFTEVGLGDLITLLHTSDRVIQF